MNMFSVKVYHIAIPMMRSFDHARATRKVADSLILSIDYNGLRGVGECVPRKYVTGETIESVIKEVEACNLISILESLDFSSLNAAIKSLRLSKIYYLGLNSCCLLEIAILDLIGQIFKVSIQSILKDYIVEKETKKKISLAFFKTSQVMDLSLDCERFLGSYKPFHYVKVKVTKDIGKNVEKLSCLRKSFGGNIPISVDANMAWSYEEAMRQIEVLEKFNITYYEEPLYKKSWLEYKKLKENSSAKILLDESVCNSKDLQEAVSHKACDAINIRISKCGGLIPSCELINLAALNNLSYQIGAQVAETGPLIAAGRHLRGAVMNPVTFEAGQPDRLFNKNYIIDPMPLVNRSSNLATRVNGNGLGVKLTKNIEKYCKKIINFIDTKKESVSCS